MSLPLYMKILTDLKQQILNGQLTAGAKLPTEKELSESYSVSRITSKRALTELEQDGLIYRVRGKGSFVKAAHTSENSTSTAANDKPKRILFVLPFVNDLSVGNFNEGLAPVMAENHTDVMMVALDFLANKTATEVMAEFDGMIYYVNDIDQYLDLLLELSLSQFPVILLDKKLYDLPYPAVLSDNVDGGRQATKALIAEGHRHIAYLFWDVQHPQSVRQRYLGYIQELKEAGLSFHTSMDDQTANAKMLTRYLAAHPEITALICENDLVAIDAMRQIRQAGKTVPDDYSIIGFDDIQAAALVDPPLTTVAQNFKELGATAGRALLEQLQKNAIPTDALIPVTLVKRRSTRQIH